jgi:hypothetical protein
MSEKQETMKINLEKFLDIKVKLNSINTRPDKEDVERQIRESLKNYPELRDKSIDELKNIVRKNELRWNAGVELNVEGTAETQES